MKYYLYILKTFNDTLYTGIAVDVIKRFDEHLNNPKKGAKYTKSHKPKEIVYIDIFDDRSQATKEEYRIKKTLTRKEKLILIENNQTRTDKILKKLSKENKSSF